MSGFWSSASRFASCAAPLAKAALRVVTLGQLTQEETEHLPGAVIHPVHREAEDGDLKDAVTTLREALQLLIKLRKSQPIAQAFYCLSGLLYEQSNSGRAAVMVRAADAIARKYDLRLPERKKLDFDALYPVWVACNV